MQEMMLALECYLINKERVVKRAAKEEICSKIKEINHVVSSFESYY
jgi:hypothetical protein